MLKLVSTISIVLLLGVGMLWLTGCHHRTPEKRAESVSKRIAKKLDLDPSQKAHLDQIMSEIVDRFGEMHADKSATRQALVEQLRQEQVDPDAIKAIFEPKRAKIDEMLTLLTTRLAEFHRTLTPQQREMLIEEIEKHQHSWRFSRNYKHHW